MEENQVLTTAAQHFVKLVQDQLARVERMKSVKDFVDYSKLDKIIIGVCRCV